MSLILVPFVEVVGRTMIGKNGSGFWQLPASILRHRRAAAVDPDLSIVILDIDTKSTMSIIQTGPRTPPLSILAGIAECPAFKQALARLTPSIIA